MNENKEYAIVPNHYANDYCLQVMLGYRNYAILYGNNKLMCYKNFKCRQKEINTYLKDEMRYEFPYSTIPEHAERKFLIKINYVNQIFDYERPYIFIHDGLITKLSFFKEKSKVISHSQLLNGSIGKEKIKTVTREEIEKYLKTGFIDNTDCTKYQSIYIFSINGLLHDSSLLSEKKIIDQEKQRLMNIVDDEMSGYNKETLNEFKNAINLLNSIEPCYLVNDGRLMIKFKSNNEMKLEYFVIKYIKPNVYKLIVSDIPVTIQSLQDVISKINIDKIKYLREPRISLFSNPNISKEMIEQEKLRILAKNI